jgi:hypothetical protein
MRTVLRLILLAVVVGLGIWLWTVLFPSPQKVILKQMTRLAAAATYDGSDNNLIRAGKANRVAGMFTADAEIVVNAANQGTHHISGQEDIRNATMAGFANIPSLKVKFLDASAQVATDQQSAVVTCTAQVWGGDSKDFEAQEMRFQFKKVEGNWQISRAETIKTLQ